jgi:hypothetical protein
MAVSVLATVGALDKTSHDVSVVACNAWRRRTRCRAGYGTKDAVDRFQTDGISCGGCCNSCDRRVSNRCVHVSIIVILFIVDDAFLSFTSWRRGRARRRRYCRGVVDKLIVLIMFLGAKMVSTGRDNGWRETGSIEQLGLDGADSCGGGRLTRHVAVFGGNHSYLLVTPRHCLVRAAQRRGKRAESLLPVCQR